MMICVDLFRIEPLATEGLVKIIMEGEPNRLTTEQLDELERIEDGYLILWDEGPSYGDEGLYYEAWDRAFL